MFHVLALSLLLPALCTPSTAPSTQAPSAAQPQPAKEAGTTAASGESSQPAPEKRLSLELGAKFFFYNLEGSDYAVRTSRTLFGDIVDARLRYRIGDNASVRAGVVAILPMSEDDFDLRWGDYYRDFRPGDHSLMRVHLIQPYLQLRYEREHFALVLGDLDTPHAYHVLLVYDVYEFLRPTEKGLQILYRNHLVSEDLFINWRELNAPGRHERFDLGSTTTLAWPGGSASMQVLYAHRGGVEFPQDPVEFENISAAAAVSQSIRIERGPIDRIGVEIVPLYTVDLPPTAPAGARTKGLGALRSGYADRGEWRFKGGYWTGSDRVYAEEGFPFSKTGRFAYGQVSVRKKLSHNLRAELVLTAGVSEHTWKGTFFDQKIIVAWRHTVGGETPADSGLARPR